jgi:hypothetical protein
MIALSAPAFAEAQYVPSTCANGYYQNADGLCVIDQRWSRTRVPPLFATMVYATRGPDICANHGGIVELLR